MLRYFLSRPRVVLLKTGVVVKFLTVVYRSILIDQDSLSGELDFFQVRTFKRRGNRRTVELLSFKIKNFMSRLIERFPN